MPGRTGCPDLTACRPWADWLACLRELAMQVHDQLVSLTTECAQGKPHRSPSMRDCHEAAGVCSMWSCAGAGKGAILQQMVCMLAEHGWE